MISSKISKSDLHTRLDSVFESFTRGIKERDKKKILETSDWKNWNGDEWRKLIDWRDTLYNCLVLQSTVHVCRLGEYRLRKDNELIQIHQDVINHSVLETKMYPNGYEYNCDKDPSSSLLKKFDNPANIRVVKGDCVEASFLLKEKVNGRRVALLNMANRWEPSAGWPMAHNTQEEQLFRRSNLYQCLDNEVDQIEKERKWKYPIDEFGQIFSPEVVFFRSGKGYGYNFIRPRTLGIITAAAYQTPNRDFSSDFKEQRLSPEAEKSTQEKIRILFKVCLENGYTNVVFSSWGSGAFNCPPKHMAELFKIECENFKDCFENIWFSIYDDVFSKKWKSGNLGAYASVFGEEEPQEIGYTYNEF